MSCANINIKEALAKESTYEIKGKKFIVSPVFKTEGKETLGTTLLRLMTSDNKTELN